MMNLVVGVDGDKVSVSIGLALNEMLSMTKPPYGLDGIPTAKTTPPMMGRMTVEFSLAPVPCLSLVDCLQAAADDGVKPVFRDEASKREVIRVTSMNHRPVAKWDEQSGKIIVRTPLTPRYQTIRRKTGGFLRSDGSWSLPIIKADDLISINNMEPEDARIVIDDSLLEEAHGGLPEPYDGTANSLRELPVTVLKTVQANNQSAQALKTSRKSIAEKLSIMGIDNLYDLLMIRPRRYIDRSDPQDIRDLIEGETATIIGVIKEWRHPSQRLNVMIVEDSRGMTIDCTYFNARWMVTKYHPGDEVIVTGVYKPWKPGNGYVKPQLNQPTVDPIESAGLIPIMPIYSIPGKAALTQATFMHCEQELVSRLGDGFKGPSWADSALRKYKVSSAKYGDALRDMHFPSNAKSMDDAYSALAFCEIVELLVWIEATRTGDKAAKGVVNSSSGEVEKAYVASLPYSLTGAQDRAVSSIRKAMAGERPMHALLVGDVGSGKTTVMHLAAIMAVEAGHQAAICAPTSILANQLYEVFMKAMDGMSESVRSRVRPILHTTYKGKGATARRRANVEGVASGKVNLIFGTQAILNLDYHDLSFVGVDEQHKFGAAQRDRLLEVRTDGRVPDMLMQTATPIPRSMAQVYYGDVTYLALDEMPAGRQPIVTNWVKHKGSEVVDDSGSPIWADVIAETRKGHGAFVICPMVADSEKSDAASVRKTAKTLKEKFPDDVRVEAVYGGQAKDKQEELIEGFKNGDVDVLVASSVVEVGVSCDNATRMVVLDANRFGLASLHQIRGRIGRSDLPSTCWLVAMPFNDSGRSRMEAMVDTLDGWKLSKTDLRNRGTGSMFGVAQSGKSDFVYADLVRDAKWIGPARETAKSILAGPDADVAIEDAKKYYGIEEDQKILS